MPLPIKESGQISFSEIQTAVNAIDGIGISTSLGDLSRRAFDITSDAIYNTPDRFTDFLGTTTTTTAAPTTTTAALLTVTNGGVTCFGAGGSFTSTISGGSGTYSWIAIGTSTTNAISAVFGISGVRYSVIGSSFDWTGIADGTWYVAVMDASETAVVQNIGVVVNCTTPTTTTAAPPPPTTTTAAPRYRYLAQTFQEENCQLTEGQSYDVWSYQNVGSGFYTITGDLSGNWYLATSTHTDDSIQITIGTDIGCTTTTTTAAPTTTTAAPPPPTTTTAAPPPPPPPPTTTTAAPTTTTAAPNYYYNAVQYNCLTQVETEVVVEYHSPLTIGSYYTNTDGYAYRIDSISSATTGIVLNNSIAFGSFEVACSA